MNRETLLWLIADDDLNLLGAKNFSEFREEMEGMDLEEQFEHLMQEEG